MIAVFLCLTLFSDAPDVDPAIKLYSAVAVGDLDTLTKAFEKGISVESPNTFGDTLLLQSIALKRIDVFEFLRERGANLRAKNNRGETAVYLAARNGQTAILEQLIDAGLPLKAKGLLQAAAGSGDIDTFELVRSSKRKFNKATLRNAVIAGAEGGNPAIVEQLLDMGGNLKVKKDDYTLLQTAALYGRLEMFLYLKEKGLNTKVTNNLGDSLLHLAARAEDPSVLKELLETETDVDTRNREGQTPLMTGVLAGRHKAVITLMHAGADPNLEDKFGESPMAYTGFLRNRELYRAICDNGYEGAKLICAARLGDLNALNELKAQGADLNLRNPAGEHALFVAASEGQTQFVKKLLELGADANEYTNFTWNPIYIAARLGHLDTVNALIAGGADPNSPVPGGDTPLGSAVQAGNVEMVKTLRENGGDILYFMAASDHVVKAADASIETLQKHFVEGLTQQHFLRAPLPFWLKDMQKQEVYNTDQGVIPPVFVHKVTPKFPAAAPLTPGSVEIVAEATLGRNGVMRDLKILTPYKNWAYGYEIQALKALKQWRYQPGTMDGQAVDVRMRLKVDFVLR